MSSLSAPLHRHHLWVALAALPQVLMLGCVALLVAQQVTLPVAVVEGAGATVSRPTSAPGHAVAATAQVSAVDGDAEVSPVDGARGRLGGAWPQWTPPRPGVVVTAAGEVAHASPRPLRRLRLTAGTSPRGPPA